MVFDPTISLGTIIATLSFVVTIIWAYTKLVGRVIGVEARVEAMWKWFEQKITEINGGRRS